MLETGGAHLKKVLALVLAFACAFTMFAGAAFTDQSDIAVDSDVVDTMTALGVIEGYLDGSFRPDDTVTRGEMAKMIYVVRTGRSDASAYNDDATTFTDIGDHWARGYIKYCNSLGIIAGHSATRFAPDDTVTTQEAAKMLLVTLGYNAERAGLVGAGWGAKTAALADENGLMKDVNNGTTQGLPRQYAAQLMYNAIFANTVTLRDGEYTKYGYDNSLNPTIGEKYMDLYKTNAGILYSCTKVDGKDYYTIKTSVDTYNKVPTDISSMIGQEIIVLRKVNASDVTVYGVYTDDDSNVVATGFVGQLEKDGTDKIKLDGTSYKLDGNVTTPIVYTFNKDTSVARVSLDSLVLGSPRDADDAASEIKLIDNDGNGKIDNAVVTPIEVGKVASVTSTSVTIDGVGTVKFADDTIYDGIAKDDYVRVIDDAYTVEGGNHVEKLDVTSGKVVGTKGSAEVKIDSTWYKLATRLNLENDATYDFVIVGNTVLFADKTDGSIQNVAYISATGSFENMTGESTGTVKARMYFADGTDAEVKVSKVAGVKVTGAGDLTSYTDKMVTYSKLSDGTYDIKLLADGTNVAGCDHYASYVAPSPEPANGAYNKQKISGMAIADDAVIFVETKDGTAADVKVLTGKQIKDWDDTITAPLGKTAPVFASDYLYSATSGINYIQAATLVDTTGNMGVPGAKDSTYGYMVRDAYTAVVEGENKGAYEIWNGTETITVYEDQSSPSVAAQAGDLISYKADGAYVKDITVATLVGAITGVENKAEGAVAIKDAAGVTGNYTLDEDCVFIGIDSKNTNGSEAVTAESLVRASTKDVDTNGDGVAETTMYVPNVIYFLNAAGDKIVAIAIETVNDGIDGEALVAYP